MQRSSICLWSLAAPLRYAWCQMQNLCVQQGSFLRTCFSCSSSSVARLQGIGSAHVAFKRKMHCSPHKVVFLTHCSKYIESNIEDALFRQ